MDHGIAELAAAAGISDRTASLTVGLRNGRLQIDRSGLFFAVFLANIQILGCEIVKNYSRWGRFSLSTTSFQFALERRTRREAADSAAARQGEATQLSFLMRIGISPTGC